MSAARSSDPGTATTTPARAVGRGEEVRGYRLAGVGALLAAAGYVALPLIRVLFETGTVPIDDYPTPDQLGAYSGWGALGFVVFGLIATGALLTTMSLTWLADAGVAARLGSAAGLVAVVGWAMSAAGSRAMYSWIAANLAQTGADEGAQRAAVWAINVLAGSGLDVAVLGFTGWCTWLVSGRVLPRGVTVPVLVLAVLMLIAIGGFAFLPAQFGYVPAFVLLGGAALVRARELVAAHRA